MINQLSFLFCFHCLSIGDVPGPYYWLGNHVPLTSDNTIYKTVAPADGALIGFSTMIYDIIYLRQGHGGKGFNQNRLIELLNHANLGTKNDSFFERNEGIY